MRERAMMGDFMWGNQNSTTAQLSILYSHGMMLILFPSTFRFPGLGNQLVSMHRTSFIGRMDQHQIIFSIMTGSILCNLKFSLPATLRPLFLAISLGTIAFGTVTANVTTIPSSWRQFKDSKDRSTPETLTDFSYAGFDHGEQGVPKVSGPIFKVTDFGAIPNDDHSSEDAIRKAVNAAEKAGGGVVLFPPGRFLVWTDRNNVEPIRIHSSGIVIRGAGSGKNGTVIRAVHSGYGTGPYKVPKDGKEFAAINYVFSFEAPDQSQQGSHKGIALSGEVKRSSFEIPLTSTEGLHPGDRVSIRASSKELTGELMAGLQPDARWKRAIEGLSINEIHKISAIHGATLILCEPLLVHLEKNSGATLSKETMIDHDGIEDIAFEGAWKESFVHHRSSLDDEGWDAILFSGVADGWVLRCSFFNMNSGVYLRKSTTCTVMEIRFLGNPAHYDVAARSDSSFNLLGLTDEQEGQLHAASTGNRSSGTTVWRWTLLPDQSIDSHGNGPYATLIDRVNGGTMTHSGGPMIAFPNHLCGMVYWNFLYQGNDKMPVDFWDLDKGGVAKFVKPLFVGLHGKTITLNEASLQGNESPGSPVSPESLYEAQLELRLGKLPAWVKATQAEWEGLTKQELPFPLTFAPSSNDIMQESFPINDLFTDVKGLMTKEELGWGVPIEFQVTGAIDSNPVIIKNDYVLLRSILQLMATYATQSPQKSNSQETGGIAPWKVGTQLDCKVSLDSKTLAIMMPVHSSVEDQKADHEALEKALALSPACKSTLADAGGKLTLTIQR